ncbi:MAG: motility associated factor glycosyltransferase family protein [Myxococcota bacterium]
MPEPSTDGGGHEIEEFEARDGATVLRERGVILGSAYDTERDAERVAETMAKKPADLMIALGFGMGTQFAPFLARNPCTLIIFEPSLERLRAALLNTSVVELLEENRDCYIAYDLDQFTQLLSARYSTALRIQAFPHPAILRLDPDPIAAVLERTQRIKEATDTRIMTSVEQLMPWALLVAHNGRRIAESTQICALADQFRGKVVVVCAAGPSLDKQLPLLRKYRDRVVVISIGQTLKALRAAGITPDLVHILESQDVAHQLTESGATEDLTVVLSPDCHPAIYDVPTRACFTATVSSSPFAQWMVNVTGEQSIRVGGGTVAQGAVGIAAMLGAKTVALIGQDLAFTDGRAYAKGTAYDFVKVEMSEDGKVRTTNMKEKAKLDPTLDTETTPNHYDMGDVIWVDGWHDGERVATSRVYASFIEQYREIRRYLEHAGVELVNCTEGGARIPRVPNRPFQELLEAEGEESLDARSQILACFDASVPRTLADYAPEVAKSRALLCEVEREAKKASLFLEKKRKMLIEAKHDAQKVKILRGMAHHEKRIRTRLERMPWLDALVQPEIYSVLAATRRPERHEPSMEDLLDEAQFLINAAKNGVDRARTWFDAFEDAFQTDRPSRIADSRLPFKQPIQEFEVPAGFLF